MPTTLNVGDTFRFGYGMFRAWDVDGFRDGSQRLSMGGGVEVITDRTWRVTHIFVSGRPSDSVDLEVTVFPKRAVRLADRRRGSHP